MEDNKLTQRRNLAPEINFRSMANILFDNSRLIVFLTLGAALSALALSLAMPKVYRVNSSIQMGYVTNADGLARLIESTNQIKDKIENDVYGFSNREKTGVSRADYPHISIQTKENSSIISFSIESSQTDIAKKILEGINSAILADNEKTYRFAKEMLDEKAAVEKVYQERLVSKTTLLESEKKTLFGMQIGVLSSPVSMSVAEREIIAQNIQGEISNISAEIENSYLKINESKLRAIDAKSQMMQIQPTTVVEVPYVSENPVSPRVAMNVALAALLGFLSSVLLIFLSVGFANEHMAKLLKR